MRTLFWLCSTALWVTLLSACSFGPEIIVEKDPGVDMKSYKTFNFFEPLGTDRAGYSTMLSSWLKSAVRTQMERVGYVYQEQDPGLRVNFFLKVKDQEELVSQPYMGPSFYGYRGGMYQMWSGYPGDVATVTYKVGTLSIDLIDAKRKMVVWHGLAEGRVEESSMRNPGPAIDRVVGEIFANFPNPPDD